MKLTTVQAVAALGNFATEVILAAKNQELILTGIKHELEKVGVKCQISKENIGLADKRDYVFDLSYEGVTCRCRFSPNQIEGQPIDKLLNCMLNDLVNNTQSAKPRLVFQAVELPK